MAGLAEARSPRSLLDEVTQAREVLVLTYTATLEYFERFALADARALGAVVTVISDATMVHADPVVVRRAGTQYLDGRALCPRGAFHPKLFVIVGDDEARVAIGSGNLTIAGWNANAEVWTVLRGDKDGGPRTLGQVASFLRDLAGSPIAFGPGAVPALERVADRIDDLPVDEPGPTLLHSLHQPIAEQLPEGPVQDLVLYAPFHDTALTGTKSLLQRLQPDTWTVFVQPDTDVEGSALAGLADSTSGRVAWVARQASKDGHPVSDDRYWHGKLIQWRQGDTRWALTGSPNLSAPALLRTVPQAGNCELALLAELNDDLTPAEGEAPPGGIATLVRSSNPDEAWSSGVVLMSATLHADTVVLELHKPLRLDATLQRYDVTTDQWRPATKLPAGEASYSVAFATAPVGTAVRLLLGDEETSNSVFVCDLERVIRPHIKAIGKARVTPAEIARLGLGNQLLADLEELRPQLLRVGAIATPAAPVGENEQESGEEVPESARPAPGISLEDYLAACDPVLGQRATEFALVLPPLPGVSVSLDDTVGTLDTDEDSDTLEDEDAATEPTLAEELRRSTDSDRERYRRFLEQLVKRAAEFPVVVRTLAVRSVLHGVEAHLWAEQVWPDVLAKSLLALGAPGDEPNDHERSAAASLAAVSLAVLRADVGHMATLDESALRYLDAGRAVASLLADTSSEQIAMLAANDLPRHLAGTPGILAANSAIDEILNPPTGAARAARLLSDEYNIAAEVTDGLIIDLEEPVGGVAEPRLLLGLGLARDVGPIYIRGRDTQGRVVTGAWCKPWLAIERDGDNGPFGRAWKLPTGQTPEMLEWEHLPKATCAWAAGESRPSEVTDLLDLLS